jgi:hypothetical protein
MLFVGFRGRLVLMRQPENSTFIPWPTDELQTDREAARIETARNADRRQSKVVREQCVFRREGPRVRTCVLDGRDGRRGRRQQHDINVFERTIRDCLSVCINGTHVTEGRHIKGRMGSHDVMAKRPYCFHGSLECDGDLVSALKLSAIPIRTRLPGDIST